MTTAQVLLRYNCNPRQNGEGFGYHYDLGLDSDLPNDFLR